MDSFIGMECCSGGIMSGGARVIAPANVVSHLIPLKFK